MACVSGILVSCALLVAAVIPAPAPTASQPDIELFTREGCPRCRAALAWLSAVQGERPELAVVIRHIDGNAENRQRLERLFSDHGGGIAGVPALWIRGRWLVVGFDDPAATGARILAFLDGATESAPHSVADGTCSALPASPCEPPAADRVETRMFGALSARELGLPLFTIAIGLLDGFNPCAMWVLLFLLSLLVNLRSRARMFAIAGTFIVVSGVVYFAFMAAWLNVFVLVGLLRPVQVVLGLVALVVGGLNVKDFFAFRRGPSLVIPDSAKPGIHARMRAVLSAPTLWAAMAAASTLAVAVNVIELLCTAGFPAVYTQVLASHRLPWWEYGAFLVLYNIAYVADDALMLAIAVYTLGRRRLEEREGRVLKLVSGAVMVALGTALLFRPEWLAP